MENKIIKNIIDNYNTPTYVFDISKLNKRIMYLRNMLPKKVQFCYAIKANTFVIKEMEENIDRFEVCSTGEYKICKEKNIQAKKILISGVNKRPDEIKQMILDGITYFTIESMEQFGMLKEMSRKTKLNTLIRITSGNQFGINLEEAKTIIKNRGEYKNLNIIGLQYFSGTQKKSIKNLTRELEYIQKIIMDLKENYNYEAEELEYGPGFPVKYFQNEEFDESEFLNEFSNLINQINFKGKITLEFGRSMVADCGSYITKIVDIKTNNGQNYAILDGGINHLVYYGQSMAMKLPICSIYPERENHEEKWNLCGSLCTTNDILVKQFRSRKNTNWRYFYF